MSKRLLLLDGHSILNRAFYGVPLLTNSEGAYTNGVYGFLNIMFKILEEEKPEYMVVAFDVSAPTFRHQMYDAYKGTRKGMPDELRAQVPIIKEVLTAMHVKILELPGFEADDVLGTLARRAEAEGLEVSIISGDRDLLQLATDKIKIRIPKTKMHGTEVEDYYAKDVIEKYTVTPTEFIDVKALMGDASDNIPGVPSIGEKTATKIIATYGSIEKAYEEIEGVMPKRAREALIEHKELAVLSKKLAQIHTHCEFDFSIEDAQIQDFFNEEVFIWFKKLEFKSFLTKYNYDVPQTNVDLNQQFKTINSYHEATQIFDNAFEASRLSIVLVGDNELIGVSLVIDETKVYFIVMNSEISKAFLLDNVLKLYNTNLEISTIHFKEQLSFIELPKPDHLFDVSLAGYLLNPLKDSYDYDDIGKDYLGIHLPARQELLGKQSLEKAILDLPDKVASYGAYLAYISYTGTEAMKTRLVDEGMYSLYEDIELPLLYVLHSMEQFGIKVDSKALKEYGDRLQERIVTLEQEIHQLAAMTFNINSPKQLGEILFEKLALPNGKKTKTGYSTASDVLEKLKNQHPIIPLIMEYRQLTKLKSTYADGLANYIGKDDSRIHGKFNQTIAATGRISSTEPNLQNIPIRLALGREIRKVFVPEDDFVFVDADYSQIELRVLAHISQDETLIRAYHEDDDIHRITASQVFHTPFEEVTPLQRSNAKAVNFGIVYGISAFGLSQDLGIAVKEAERYIKQYFQTYPKVKQFLDDIVIKAKEQGYVDTMFGRRRPIPELKSSNYMQRSFGERIAMNSPIQGTAADIIKIAMIRVDKRLKDLKLRSKLILQVHDELLIEAHCLEIELVKTILEEEMKGAVQLAVPLEVDVNEGHSWYETK